MFSLFYPDSFMYRNSLAVPIRRIHERQEGDDEKYPRKRSQGTESTRKSLRPVPLETLDLREGIGEQQELKSSSMHYSIMGNARATKSWSTLSKGVLAPDSHICSFSTLTLKNKLTCWHKFLKGGYHGRKYIL